jgi:hypothetical protein
MARWPVVVTMRSPVALLYLLIAITGVMLALEADARAGVL